MTTDSDIIRRARADPSAFGELFDRHARAIHRYARARTSETVADDVVGDTFLIAFQRRDSFDLAWDDAAPWLFGIATNLIRRHSRVESRTYRALQRSGAPPGTHDSTLESAERMDAALGVSKLARTLRALPAIDRDTLLLYAWGDLSYEEIARAMDVPIGTVRSRLNRVRRRLSTPATNPSTIEVRANEPDNAAAPTA